MQLKSNCGTLVIDDFGRQRMSTDELLNRWIVPLEKRYDFLNLANGKKIQVPFDQLIVFSTNLEPRDLVDDAFLRRIPYKIEVIDPDRGRVPRPLPDDVPPAGRGVRRDAVDYLIETHYRRVNRPFRCCQPRDLLLQIRNYCRYECREPELSCESARLRRRELLRGDVMHDGSAGLADSLVEAFRAEVQSQLRILVLGVRVEFLEQQARLNVPIVLVLVAGILGISPAIS